MFFYRKLVPPGPYFPRCLALFFIILWFRAKGDLADLVLAASTRSYSPTQKGGSNKMVRVLFGTIGSAFLELARKGVKPLQKGAVEKLLLVKNCPSDQGDAGIGGGILPVGLGGGGHELLKISAPLIGDGIHRFVGKPVPFDDVVFSRGWRNF